MGRPERLWINISLSKFLRISVNRTDAHSSFLISELRVSVPEPELQPFKRGVSPSSAAAAAFPQCLLAWGALN